MASLAETVNLGWQRYCSFDHEHGFLGSLGWILVYGLSKEQQPFNFINSHIYSLVILGYRTIFYYWQYYSALQRRVWLCLPHTLLPDIYTLNKIPPSPLFRLNTPSSFSLSFCQILIAQWSSRLFAGLAPVCPYLSSFTVLSSPHQAGQPVGKLCIFVSSCFHSSNTSRKTFLFRITILAKVC